MTASAVGRMIKLTWAPREALMEIEGAREASGKQHSRGP